MLARLARRSPLLWTGSTLLAALVLIVYPALSPLVSPALRAVVALLLGGLVVVAPTLALLGRLTVSERPPTLEAVAGRYFELALIYACIYFFLTVIGGTAHFAAPPGSVLAEPFDVWTVAKLAAAFFECFYFSLVTQTTLGYGDITPRGVLARSIMMSQVFFGVMVIAVGLQRWSQRSRQGD